MGNNSILEQLQQRLGESTFTRQVTMDEILTLWVPMNKVKEVLQYLKTDLPQPFPLLFDLTAIDERARTRFKQNGYPHPDFALVYHLFSFERNSFIRLKVALSGEFPSAPSITSLWANANWYERE